MNPNCPTMAKCSLAKMAGGKAMAFSPPHDRKTLDVCAVGSFSANFMYAILTTAEIDQNLI